MKTHLPTVLWALLTAVGLLAPGAGLDSLGRLPDWTPAAAHFVLFLGLTLLLGRSLRATLRPWPLATAFVIAFAYGVLLEAVQTAIPGRGFEWQDLTMNGVGGLIAILGARIAFRLDGPIPEHRVEHPADSARGRRE